MLEGIKANVEKNDNESIRPLLSQRLHEIKDEVAPDYNIPEALWAQMLNALEKGGGGAPFTKEELANFDDATKVRIGDFLAKATRGMVPGSDITITDSQGYVGRKKDLKGIMDLASQERQQN